ncbi:MAG: hypothetical protein COV74_09255 [Candidatus Omnitrophica bacterium CG11_big_fil_rev_8_21_14_0_20_45_26]|uniref:Uncharacterized protein n=1 Tax=Candidatus Abzuiibacterium crystallinum TaxID=1974748 RepID=A0A2H0LLY6_9BACT|nr:MAG: hypothetical protein COV74_09255 [Candidatus Omnitrophica bacterium CG11_big_fil_rev_8_21_14_0_20_45_26]PIW63258.1 MAG: hypothetical protein COW12_11230 [Candidatus Omnitrophica bacterium CG12_big_fil_rev_8_21_14_0_65_45_16]
MFLEVQENPNSKAHPLMVFEDLDQPKTVFSILIEREGKEVWADVVGVHEEGIFKPARVQKVADSGAGAALLVYGGLWGIRFRLKSGLKPWNLKESTQWGMPYFVCADEEGICCDEY